MDKNREFKFIDLEELQDTVEIQGSEPSADDSGESQKEHMARNLLQSQLNPEEGQEAAYIDDSDIHETYEAAEHDSSPLIVKKITPAAYAAFVNTHDSLPLAGIGLYERMQKKGEDARIYGGYLDGQLVIAMICRNVQAWKLFCWLEAPFGPVSEDPEDTKLLVKFIRGIEDLEDKDTLLFLQFESFIEYQKHGRNGQVLPDWNHKAWRQSLIDFKLRAAPLQTGFEPGRQARFAAVLELANDGANYQGIPAGQTYMHYPQSVLMKTSEEILEGMEPRTRARVDTGRSECIQVRLLAENELSLLDELKGGALDREPLDLGYLESYAGQSAVVYVTLDVEAYGRQIREEYARVSDKLQTAFLDAKRSNTRKKQDALVKAMNRMQSWDRKIADLEEIEKTGQAQIPLAAGLFLFNQGETLCLWSAVNPDYTWLPGLEAMHWFMIDWSRSRCALRYTFWGLSGNTQPGEEGYEAFAFSRGFGARLAEYSGAFTAAFKPGSTKAYHAYLRSRNLQ